MLASKGGLRERSITDCICCILMLTFWVACVFLGIYAVTNGNPWNLMQTYDVDERPCGKDALTDFPIAYIFNPIGNLNKIVCVSECPQWQPGQPTPGQLNCASGGAVFNSTLSTCANPDLFDFANPQTGLSGLLQQKVFVYNTTNFLGKICLPSSSGLSQVAVAFIQNMTNSTIGQQVNSYVTDIAICWKYILIITGIAIAVSLVSLVLLRFLSGILIWLFILAFLAAIFVLGGLALCESNRLYALDPN